MATDWWSVACEITGLARHPLSCSLCRATDHPYTLGARDEDGFPVCDPCIEAYDADRAGEVC